MSMFKFVDFARGVTLYRKVDITGVVWFSGVAQQIVGGTGAAEIYHRK